MTSADKREEYGCSLEHFNRIWSEIQEQPAWRTRADREADYFDGNQLDSEILQAQKEKGIPPSIENLIGSTVNDIIGMEAKNRTDWKVSPESGVSEDDLAAAINQKLNKAERESGADRATAKGYEALVKVGVGWIEVARNRDPFKFPYRVSFVHRNEIWWDMKAREPDLSDAMWLMRRRWVPLNLAEMMFPDKKDLLHQAGTGWATVDLADMALDGGGDTGLAASQEIERGWTIEEQEWRDIESNRVCLFEVSTRHYKRILVIKTPDGRTIEFDKDNPLHVQACACGYHMEEAVVSEIWKTFFCGPHELHREKVSFKKGRFDYVPFFGNIEDRTGVPYGVIRNLMYLQDEVNARISRMQWGLAATRTERTENAVAMSDEVFRKTIGRPDADIILNKKEMQTGGIFRVERDFDLDRQQYDRLVDLRNSIKSVSGVTDAFQGQGGHSTVSGLQAQIEQTVQALATVNDHYKFARNMVGELLLQLIIEDSQDREEVVVSGGLVKDDRVVVINDPVIDHETGVEYRTNDVQRAMLKVALSDVPTTPSFRQQQLTAMSEAFKAAPAQFQSVMMPHLTALMDIPNKEEIVKAIRQISQTPTPEEIEQRIKDEVSKALAESDRDLKVKELEIKSRKTDAEIEKILNEAVNKAVDSMYSAMQAAGVITNTPATAPLADKLLKSAGYQDQDNPPLVPEYPGGQGQESSQQPGQQLPPNYDPTTPVPVPAPVPGGDLAPQEPPGPGYAGEGQAAGIETQRIEEAP